MLEELRAGVGIRVKEILMLPAFAGARLIAGAQGVDRVVTNVNVMEVPDILAWVKKGDLLVTTGYAIKDDEEAQRELIPGLAERGVAALALKARRFMGAIPAYMAEAAESLNFPLLELPLEANFSDIISAVLAQIVNKQTIFLQKSLAVHQEFTNLMLRGGELEQIAAALANLLNAYVCLQDNQNLRRALFPPWSLASSEEDRLALKLLEGENEWEAGEVRVGDNEASPAFVGLRREEVEIGKAKADLVALPVIVEGKVYGSVKALVLDRKFSLLDLLSLERVCSIVALDILKRHVVLQVEHRYRAEFLNQFLASDGSNEREFVERAKIFGWDLTKQFVVLLLSVLLPAETGKVAEDERANQLTKNQAMTVIDSFCQRNRIDHMLVSNENGIVLCVSPQGVEDEAAVSGWLKAITRQLRQVLSPWRVTIGIGGLYGGPAGIRKSYHEAKLALEIGRTIYGSGSDIYYSKLGVYGLLLRQASLREQKAFAEEVLGPLLVYDRTRKTDLLRTLVVYLNTGGNAKKTASALFTHYNTVLYRLAKIKELTNLDPDHPEQRVTLQVAVRLLEIFGQDELCAYNKHIL